MAHRVFVNSNYTKGVFLVGDAFSSLCFLRCSFVMSLAFVTSIFAIHSHCFRMMLGDLPSPQRAGRSVPAHQHYCILSTQCDPALATRRTPPATHGDRAALTGVCHRSFARADPQLLFHASPNAVLRKFVLLSLNRFERKKNLRLAIDAFMALRERLSGTPGGDALLAETRLVLAGP